MILACDHLNKSFGDRRILRDASFHIQEKEKYALVGVNGIGKTTLLQILMDEERYDSGTITKSREATIGYLPQQLGYHSEHTIYEELYAVRQDLIGQEARIHELEKQIAEAENTQTNTNGSGSHTTNEGINSNSDQVREDDMIKLLDEYHRLQTDFELKDGYAYESQVMGVINGLGFGSSKDQIINELSGGQKTRVALGKLLLTKPDLLILDEPTNHLDITSVEWLENYLANYPGAVLIVSHDRYFLDRFATHVWELDQAVLRCFKGNYTSYMKQKEILQTSLMHQYEKQQAEIRHQEEVIKKLKQFNREKSIKRAESREKILDRIDRMENPTEHTESMHFKLEPAITSGNDVLFIEGLSKRFDENMLFTDTNIDIKRGEKVAILGDNGTGKTTLLRMINGTESITDGTITLGTGVEVGYYDQEHGILHDEKTIFEEIQDDYPYLNNTQIRNTLAAFLFREDDVFKRISDLSGGEKGRVSLAKLMLSEANLLLLDEPTNHLDMISREILESALNEYAGTVICVSHDRYFIDRVATRIINLVRDDSPGSSNNIGQSSSVSGGGHFVDYKGNYSYYLEKKDEINRSKHNQSDNNRSASNGLMVNSSDRGKYQTSGTGNQLSPTKNSNDNSSNQNRSGGSSREEWLADKERQAERRRLERAYADIESEIEKLENELAEIDEQLSDPAVGTDLPKLTELTNKRNEIDTALNEAMSTWEQLGEQLL
ncbi:MAG: ABC-F type ribosomal protection protein [Eubacterium sp.]|nr:ABC-F type ribosomal protection protein [Eubacterium sp.]